MRTMAGLTPYTIICTSSRRDTSRRQAAAAISRKRTGPERGGMASLSCAQRCGFLDRFVVQRALCLVGQSVLADAIGSNDARDDHRYIVRRAALQRQLH